MQHARRILIPAFLGALVVVSAMLHSVAQERRKPAPTQANVRYGPHERNVFDFWQARSDAPAPVAVFIHGGGFRRGAKEGVNADVLNELLAAGVSVASFNYRFVDQSPLPAAHHDCRRALQVLRSRSAEWNLDKTRIGAFGSSAGAQLSMYLAFHDDMARPESDDPVERESTRLTCVATIGGQTTLDVDWWIKNIPGYDRPHRDFQEAFGVSNSEVYHKAVSDVSAMALLSKDDPPIFMTYAMPPDAPVPDGERAENWKVHHVAFGIALKEKADALGVEAHLSYPGTRDRNFRNLTEFLRAKLLPTGAQ